MNKWITWRHCAHFCQRLPPKICPKSGKSVLVHICFLSWMLSFWNAFFNLCWIVLTVGVSINSSRVWFASTWFFTMQTNASHSFSWTEITQLTGCTCFSLYRTQTIDQYETNEIILTVFPCPRTCLNMDFVLCNQSNARSSRYSSLCICPDLNFLWRLCL